MQTCHDSVEVSQWLQLKHINLPSSGSGVLFVAATVLTSDPVSIKS